MPKRGLLTVLFLEQQTVRGYERLLPWVALFLCMGWVNPHEIREAIGAVLLPLVAWR